MNRPLLTALSALLLTTPSFAWDMDGLSGRKGFEELAGKYGAWASWAEMCGDDFQPVWDYITYRLNSLVIVHVDEGGEILDAAHREAYANIWQDVDQGTVALDQTGCARDEYNKAEIEFRTYFYGWQKPAVQDVPLPPELPMFFVTAVPALDNDAISGTGYWQSVSTSYSSLAVIYRFCGLEDKAVELRESILGKMSKFTYFDVETARGVMELACRQYSLPRALEELRKSDKSTCNLENESLILRNIDNSLQNKMPEFERIDYQFDLEAKREPMTFDGS